MPARQREQRVQDLMRACSLGLASTQSRQNALSRLRQLLTVDAAFLATVDPETLLFTSAVSESPLVTAAPLFLANELAGSDVNRFIDLAVAPDPVATLDRSTGGDRPASERYAHIMRGLGLGDELRVALRTGRTCWGVLCLHRANGQAGFDERDLRIVRRTAPYLAEGLRLAALVTGADTRAAPTAGIVVLDRSGTVVSMNDTAETWLAEIADADWPSSAELPMALLVAAATLDHIDEPSQRPPRLRLRTERGRWLEIHATHLHGPDGRNTAIVLEQAHPAALTSLVLAAHAVTGAQARVVTLVLRGYSTQQIVNRLHISSHTVQEHLTAAFDKFGVRSRRELAAALLIPHQGGMKP